MGSPEEISEEGSAGPRGFVLLPGNNLLGNLTATAIQNTDTGNE